MDGFPLSAYGLPLQVNLQFLIADYLSAAASSAQHSQHPLAQYLRGKGFCYIVVPAHLESPDHIFVGVVGGEKDDGGVPCLPEPGAQVQAAAVGQADIHQTQVKTDSLPKLLGLGGVVDQRHGVAVLLQGGLHSLPQQNIIFYQQKLGHRHLLKTGQLVSCRR